jgi:hypothetical protein
MSDSEILIYNNNILDKTIKDAPTLVTTKALTEEDKANFLKNYKEHFWNTQVKHTQDLLKEDSGVQIFQDPEITSSGAPTGGLTKTQLNQKAFNDKIANVIDSREGGVTKGDYTFGLLNGKWAVYDKYGNIKEGTQGITNPTVLATYIGGTLAKPNLKAK